MRTSLAENNWACHSRIAGSNAAGDDFECWPWPTDKTNKALRSGPFPCGLDWQPIPNVFLTSLSLSLLLLVDQLQRHHSSIGVRAFGRGGHRLTVARNHRASTGVILSTRLFRFVCEGIGMRLFDRDAVIRRPRACDRSPRAIVFCRVAGVDSAAIRPFPRIRDLHAAGNRFPY